MPKDKITPINGQWIDAMSIPVRMSDETLLRMDDNEWAIPSTNAKNQTHNINGLKIPVEVERNYQLMVQRSGLPYKTVQDAYRHAIYRHLVWMNEIRKRPRKTAYNAARAALEYVQNETARDTNTELVAAYVAQMTKYLNSGHLESAIKDRDFIRDLLADARPGPDKDRLMALFLEKTKDVDAEIRKQEERLEADELMEQQEEVEEVEEEVEEVPVEPPVEITQPPRPPRSVNYPDEEDCIYPPESCLFYPSRAPDTDEDVDLQVEPDPDHPDSPDAPEGER